MRPELDRVFGSLRRSGKGKPTGELFHPLCFFRDGTSRHLVRFDADREDEGYAAAIETAREKIASSHMIKRFFCAFKGPQTWLFRRVLQQIVLWRVRQVQPRMIVLDIDNMVMENDEAARYRAHVQEGQVFQPLQITWGRLVVDAVFRGGSKHSNAGDAVANAVRHLVSRIRTQQGSDMPIVVRGQRASSTRSSQRFEDLEIGYICSGSCKGTSGRRPRRQIRLTRLMSNSFAKSRFASSSFRLCASGAD